MEGKCVLFKALGDVDVFSLCIKSKDVDEIVNTVYLISGSCGDVNLEDIAAPHCFEIKKKLKSASIKTCAFIINIFLFYYLLLPLFFTENHLPNHHRAIQLHFQSAKPENNHTLSKPPFSDNKM